MAPAAARVCIIIVSYNVRRLLDRCLTSTSDADEVVVVDNASSDESAAMVREKHPSVRLVAHETNVGFSAAVNCGVRESSAELLLLLNPDASIAPGSLTRMATALTSRPDAVAVGFRQVDTDGAFQLAFGPPALLSLDLVRRAVQRRLDRGNTWLAAGLDLLMSRPLPVPWVAGSSLLVWRDAFEGVGGFDERFFLFFEDIDFCLRLRAAGGRVYYDPTVTVVHERGASADLDPIGADKAYRRSQLLFWEKHRGPWAKRAVAAYQSLRGVAADSE
ncbi:MAG: glycosyltransferase family 2 protein [Myxococcota bacterium]